jgi:hypothetical protein
VMLWLRARFYKYNRNGGGERKSGEKDYRRGARDTESAKLSITNPDFLDTMIWGGKRGELMGSQLGTFQAGMVS